MAHLADEIVGIAAAGVAAYMASKAKQSAEKGTSVTGTVREVVIQRLPKMFGFGRTDEQLFETLRQLLDADNRRIIDVVLDSMQDFEVDIFRLTVTGISCGSELSDKKEIISWEFTAKDLRVEYLKNIAEEVSRIGGNEQIAATQVVKRMRSRRLIVRNEAAEKALELWADATEWVRGKILAHFKVSNLGEITPEMIGVDVAGRINLLTSKIHDRRPVDVNIGFWRGNYRRYPFQTVGLAIGTVAVSIWFLILAAIN